MRSCACGCGQEITSTRISPSTGRRVEYRPGHNNVTHGLTRGGEDRRPERKEYKKRWNAENQEKIRGYGLRNRVKRYGLTVEDLDNMLKAQLGKCAICFAYLNEFAIDHDHQSGHVRGLLCRSCNLGLGKFRDDVDVVYRAFMYLRTGRMSSGAATE